jgi:hypothetical protein
MRVYRVIKECFLAAAVVAIAPSTLAQVSAEPRAVHIVWMGANDCPPCVAWRLDGLPKLQKSPEFNSVTFSHVTKLIKSPVPSSIFLPDEVKAHKAKLDYASSGRHGSPQAAILVNGEVFDYFHGTRSAEDFERMLVAIRTSAKYPFERCVKASKEWRKCDVRG